MKRVLAFLVGLSVLTAVGYSGDIRDTIVGNLQLEWWRIPTRFKPDTMGRYYQLDPDSRVRLQDIVHRWPAEIFWLRGDRIGVLFPLVNAVAVEAYDTAAQSQVYGYYRRFLDWIQYTVNSETRRARLLSYAWQCRAMRDGDIGLWGCTYIDTVGDEELLDHRFVTAYPLLLRLDTAFGLRQKVEDTSWIGRSKPRMFNWLQSMIGSVLSYDAVTFPEQVCYVVPDKEGGWWLVVYREDLQRKVVQKKFPIPFAAVIRDSLGRDSVYMLQGIPYMIQNTSRGIAGWSTTVDGERVVVLFSGENLEDVRAIKLPYLGPVGDQSTEREIGYFVEDGYVLDATLYGGRLRLAKVRDDGIIEWTSEPLEPYVFGRSIAHQVYIYRVRKSRWGGWYVVGTYDYNGGVIAYVVRYNSRGKITGYFTRKEDNGMFQAITDVVEHYSDSSFYVLGQYTPPDRINIRLMLMKFRFHPSDTTTIDGIDTPSDTTLGVWDRAAYGGVEVYPQPVRRGEQLRVVAVADVEAVEVWTLDGRRVVGMAVERSGEVAGVSMDVPAGVYVVQVRSSGGRQQRGLVMVMP
jgi:hypothetical protein